MALLCIAWQVRVRLAQPGKNAVQQDAEKTGAAVAQLEKAAAAQPFNVPLQRQLAAAYVSLGRLDESERVMERLCRLTPEDSAAWLALGQLQSHQNHLSSAAHSLERAVSLTPHDIPTLCALAQVEIKRGKTRRAEVLINQAQRADPHAGFPYFIRGQLLRRTAMAEVAIPEFQRAVAAEPGNLSGWMALADAQFQIKRLKDAETSCKNALRVDPQNADALSLLAQVKMQRAASGDSEEAARLAEQAIAAHPQDANSHYVLGVLRLRAGNAAEAITHLEAALTFDSSRLDARINLAKAYQRAGRDADAERQLKLLEAGAEYDKKVNALVAQTQARPAEPALHFQLGDLYASVGGRDKAILEYQRTLELDPNYRTAREALQRLGSK